MRLVPRSPSSHGSLIPCEIFSALEINAKFELAEAIIRNGEEIDLASNKPFSLFEGSRIESNGYLSSVMDLQNCMHFFLLEDPTSEKLITAKNLMQAAMDRLQKEYNRILSNNIRSFLVPESSSKPSSLVSPRSSVSEAFDESEVDDQDIGEFVSNVGTELEQVMWDLKAIADTMISSGYGKECVQIYKTIRKSIIDESLHYLGVEKRSSTQFKKMDWEVVELKIKSWLTAVKFAVTTLFHRELILCEHVFSAFPEVRESCFTEIAKEGAGLLFQLPKHVAKYKKLSPEKMFRVLDLYDALSEIWPEIEAVFWYDSISSIRSQAVNCLVKLGEVARYLLTEFETAIQKENSKLAVTKGGVHPLTRYVVNYLIFLSDYSGVLSDILSDFPISTQSPMPKSYYSSPVPEDHPASVISERLAWLVLVLLCKLDVKAGSYNEVALSYLFLANNLNYVVSKVRTSNLKLLLGDGWILNHEQKADQYASNYERVGWNRVISSVANPKEDMSLNTVRECFQTFNAAFGEVYHKQSTWVVPDQKLRDKIKISIAKKLIPPYRKFYEENQMTFRKEGGDVEAIVRYAPDDLGNYLSDLF